MRAFHFLRDYARREKAVSAMLGAVLFLVFLSWLSPKADTGDSLSEKSRVDTAAEMKQVTENMMKRWTEDPGALAKVLLGFSLFILLGFFIDTVFFIMWKEGHWRHLNRPERRVPWGGHDIFKTFVVLFFTEAVLSIFTAALTSGVDAGRDNAILMASTLARNVVVLLYVFYIVAKRHGAPLAELGFTVKNWLAQTAAGVLAYIGFFPVYFTLLLILLGFIKLVGYEPPVQTVVQVIYEERDARFLTAISLFIAILGPFFEEIFFRGFIYQTFRRKWGIRNGILAVSFLFALLHAHWVAFLPIFALSIMLCLVFEKTGSLIPGTVLHMFHNTASLLVMFQVKAFS